MVRRNPRTQPRRARLAPSLKMKCQRKKRKSNPNQPLLKKLRKREFSRHSFRCDVILSGTFDNKKYHIAKLVMVEWKQTVRCYFFFENNLLLQPDVVFDSESNSCNFSSLAAPGGEKKHIFYFFTK